MKDLYIIRKQNWNISPYGDILSKNKTSLEGGGVFYNIEFVIE